MSVLTEREQSLFDTAKAALPKFLFQKDGAAQELLSAGAKSFAKAWDQVDAWLGQARLLYSSSFWIDEHARDRGTQRAAGESDAALAERLRHFEDTVAPDVLKAAATLALQAQTGLTIPANYPALVELRESKAWLGTYASTTRKRAYLNRGYRASHATNPNSIVMILPYGTTAATAASVAAALRLKKAGGVQVFVETRANP